MSLTNKKGLVNNKFCYYLGILIPARIHWYISKLTGWFFVAVWIKKELRHQRMWVKEKRFYSGELQAI